jgi:hypothetical protein
MVFPMLNSHQNRKNVKIINVLTLITYVQIPGPPDQVTT